MKKNLILNIENIKKEYYLHSSPLSQMQYYLGLDSGRTKIKRALKGISLNIYQGEQVGFIGHNGSGKTTLMRIIAGLTKPTAGKIKLKGDIQSLLQSGFGFNKDLSGLQNIKNALIYNGFSPKRDKSKIAEIIKFVELGKFINYPIKTYSLGMLARLEFAAATALEPNCLIIDEVLSAGDGYFVNKCSKRMRNLVSNTTLLLVSHSLEQIKDYCERVIWIDKGLIRKDGPTDQILSEYRNYMINNHSTNEDINITNNYSDKFNKNKFFKIIRNMFDNETKKFGEISFFELQNSSQDSFIIKTGDNLKLNINVHIKKKSILSFIICTKAGSWAFDIKLNNPLDIGDHHLRLNYKKLELGVGEYILFPGLRDPNTGDLKISEDYLKFIKIPETNWSSPPLVHFDCDWSSGSSNDKVQSRISSWA